jgi:hypothetical protein
VAAGSCLRGRAKAQILVDGLNLLELDLPHRADLIEALSRSRELLDNSTRDIAALARGRVAFELRPRAVR